MSVIRAGRRVLLKKADGRKGTETWVPPALRFLLSEKVEEFSISRTMRWLLLAVAAIHPSGVRAQDADQKVVDGYVESCVGPIEESGEVATSATCAEIVHSRCLADLGHDVFSSRSCWDAEFDSWNRSLSETTLRLKNLLDTKRSGVARSLGLKLDESNADFDVAYRAFCGLEAELLEGTPASVAASYTCPIRMISQRVAEVQAIFNIIAEE